MKVYSCDICTRDFHSDEELRYTINMEVIPHIPTPKLTEADLDQDQLEVMSDYLDEMVETENDTVETPALGSVPTPMKMEYHLCPVCFGKFVVDPLGREQIRRMQYSKN
jgi:hypothetical protein